MPKLYLCSRCHAANVTAEADHATEFDCRRAWQILAGQSMAAIEVARKEIAEHQRMKHMGQPVRNREADLCARCLVAGFQAYKHLADWFAFMPKAGGKTGAVNVPPLPRSTMLAANPGPLRILPPALARRPASGPGGRVPDVAAPPVLPSSRRVDGVGSDLPPGDPVSRD